MPSSTPISGAEEPSPLARTDAHTNRAVSRPSRPTARKAVATSAPVPMASAVSSLPCRSAFRCRAVRFIQKTIHVTRPTEMIDRVPPSSSCASKVSSWVPNSSIAPKARDSAQAIAMPSHTGRRASLRSVFTRYATRMQTTRLASSPSRRPIR